MKRGRPKKKIDFTPGMRLGAAGPTLGRTLEKKKVLGTGTKTYRHGLCFDSLLEADFYTALLYTGVPFQWQAPVVFYETVRMDKKLPLFKNRGITSKKLFVDFVFTLEDGITRYIDTKGSIKFAKDKSRIKYDLLKHKLYLENRAHDTCIVWIDTSQVKSLLKLAKMPDKRDFWAYFKAIPHF